MSYQEKPECRVHEKWCYSSRKALLGTLDEALPFGFLAGPLQPYSLPAMEIPKSPPVKDETTESLARAIRRHRRALAALEAEAFAGISSARSQQLRSGIRQELIRYEQELQARGGHRSL